MKHLLDIEDKNGRYLNEEIKNGTFRGRKMFANIQKYDLKDLQRWMEKQVYMNIGQFLVGVATLGIDATPKEEIDVKALDKEFREKELTFVVMFFLGYKVDSDFNSTEKLPNLDCQKVNYLLKYNSLFILMRSKN